MTPKKSLLLLVPALAVVAGACGDDDDADADDVAVVDPLDTEVEAPDDTVMTDDTMVDDTAMTEDTMVEDTMVDGAGGELSFLPLDTGGPVTKDALQSGDVDVAVLFTSDADIAINDWVLLDDDQGLQQIENLTPAIRTEVATAPVTDVLNAVSAELTTEGLTELNRQSTEDLVESDEIASGWLDENFEAPGDLDLVDVSVTVGSTNFFEQEIVAEIYAQALERTGATVDRKFQLGARDVVAPALESGEIDLYPEYLGSLTLYADGDATVPSDPAEAAEQLRGLLPEGVTVLEPAEAENRNGLVVTAETAESYGLSTTSDLAEVTDVLVLGGPPECPERDFCLIGLQEVYGLTFQE